MALTPVLGRWQGIDGKFNSASLKLKMLFFLKIATNFNKIMFEHIYLGPAYNKAMLRPVVLQIGPL